MSAVIKTQPVKGQVIAVPPEAQDLCDNHSECNRHSVHRPYIVVPTCGKPRGFCCLRHKCSPFPRGDARPVHSKAGRTAQTIVAASSAKSSCTLPAQSEHSGVHARADQSTPID